MKKSKVSTLYMFFGILFTTCILISNIIAGKNIQVGPWTLTAGVIVFPISYITVSYTHLKSERRIEG